MQCLKCNLEFELLSSAKFPHYTLFHYRCPKCKEYIYMRSTDNEMRREKIRKILEG